jgi:PAS domain S-box-containing protein
MNRRGHAYWIVNALLAGVIYYYLAKLALTFRLDPEGKQISLFWPPMGFALAIMARCSWRCWAYLLPALIGASIIANLQVDRSWALVLMFTADDILVPAAAAMGLRSVLNHRSPFTSSRQVIAFIVATAAVSFLSATIGVGALAIEHPGMQWVTQWRIWATSTMIGVLMVAPPVMSFSREALRSWSVRKILEGAMVQVLLIVPTYLAFHRQEVTGLPVRLLVYASIPLLLWSALRSGVLGTSISLFVLGAVGIWQISTTRDYVDASLDTLIEELGWVQAYYAAVGLSSLMVAALFHEFQQSLADRKLQSTVLSMIAAGKSLEATLRQLVLGIESRVPGMIGSVLMVNPDGKTLRTAAAPNLPQEYNDLITNYPIGEGNGSCGTAAFRKELVIVEDTFTSPMWASFIEITRRHNLRACWSQPILDSTGKVHGTFAMYYREPRTPTTAERDLIQIAADLAEVALERDQFTSDIRERERTYAALISNLSGIAFRVKLDAGFTPVYFSEGALELTGFAADDFMQQKPHFASIVHPEDLSIILEQMDLAKHERRSAFSCEYRIRTKSGAERWIWNQSKLSYDESGTAVEIEGFLTDVTERKQSEFALRDARNAAEQASKAKDQFLAMLSHELRTPLTPVLLYASMMERQPNLPDETREEVKIIRHQIEQETRLIDDLLDVTRIDRGKFRIEKKPLDFRETIQRVLSLIAPSIEEKRIGLNVSLQATTHHLFADPNRMQQLVHNLMGNAIKFTKSGHIEIRTFDAGPNRLCLQVTDTGIGMTQDEIKRLFNPFEQGVRARSPEYGGLGLGLTIVKAILDLHGGNIRLESPGEGKGTTVSVTLPVTAPVPKVAAPEPAPANNHDKLKILVVEDHETSRDVLIALLEVLGHRTVSAGNLNEALALSNVPFDLLLSDIQLPDGTGHTLLTEFRKHQPIRAIALSGLGTDADLERSEAAGFAAHLVKPIDIEVLEKTIDEVISSK